MRAGAAILSRNLVPPPTFPTTFLVVNFQTSLAS